MPPGRHKGIPNKNTTFLNNRLKDMLGEDFDPVMKMAQNAVRMQQIADSYSFVEGEDDNQGPSDKGSEFDCRKDTVEAWNKIAKYCTPQLKAIEVSGNEDAPVRTKITVEYVEPKNPDSV